MLSTKKILAQHMWVELEKQNFATMTVTKTVMGMIATATKP